MIGSIDGTRRKSWFKTGNHDGWLLAAAGLLTVTGFLAIFSVDYALHPWQYVSRQIVFAAVGVLVYLFFNRIRLETWQKLATPLYVFNLVMLGATLVVGKGRGITQRWIDIGPIQFQPSELSKIILAITLAAYLANRQDQMKSASTLLGVIAHVAPVLALVYLQPHLGATLALLFMAMVATLYAGVPWKNFSVALAASVALALALWFTPNLLNDYQRERILGMVDTMHGESDIRGSGFQQHQGIMAIGNGGLTGTGFLNGDRKAAGAIPEQHTDFIFTVIGEEGGLLGCLFVFASFAFLFYRIWLRGHVAKTPMGRVVVGSLFAVLGFHFLVNMAMVLQIGPVVGLWLPFVSYGGTALWMCMAAIGLIDQAE